MKRLAIAILLLLVPVMAHAQAGIGMLNSEADGSPANAYAYKTVWPNGTTSITGGVLTLTLTGISPTAITVANEATDTSCFPVFVTAATGDLGPKSNAGLTFNSNTGLLTSTKLATGAVTLTGDGDGMLTLLGGGDGFDEDLSLNLDDTENTVVLNSTTGVVAITTPVVTTLTLAASDDPYVVLNELTGTDWWIGADDTGNTLEFRTNVAVGSNVIMEINEDGTGASLGDNGDDDITLTFNANSADGTIKWNEDEANFTASPIRVTPPAAQTIAAGNIIAADACGGLKQITADGAVTTDTTNTFTAPGAANTGCCMDVVNVGAQNITLDNNGNFFSAGAADVVMTGNDSVRVCSNGTAWYQISALLAN